MKPVLLLIFLLAGIFSLASADTYVSITSSSVYNNSDADVWREAQKVDQGDIEFDSSFTRTSPQRSSSSADSPDGDYYWLHVDLTVSYSVGSWDEVGYVYVSVYWWSDVYSPSNLYRLGNHTYSVSPGASGTITAGMRVRCPRSNFDNDNINFRFVVVGIDDADEGSILGIPLQAPTPTNTPTATNTPVNTPTWTSTPVYTSTPTNTPNSAYKFDAMAVLDSPSSNCNVVLGDTFSVQNTASRKTDDFPDVDRDYSQRFLVIDPDTGNTVTYSSVYSSALKPGQSRSNSMNYPTTGLVAGKTYRFVTTVWGPTSYESYGSDNADEVNITVITPTPTPTATSTPTPTNTPTPTPFAFRAYKVSGVVKKIPLVEAARKNPSYTYLYAKKVNYIDLYARMIQSDSPPSGSLCAKIGGSIYYFYTE